MLKNIFLPPAKHSPPVGVMSRLDLLTLIWRSNYSASGVALQEYAYSLSRGGCNLKPSTSHLPAAPGWRRSLVRLILDDLDYRRPTIGHSQNIFTKTARLREELRRGFANSRTTTRACSPMTARVREMCDHAAEMRAELRFSFPSAELDIKKIVIQTLRVL
jgi:hypothetical protein